MPTVSYNVASKIWALYVNNVSHMKLCRDGVIWEPKQESGEPQRLNMKKIHNHLRGAYNVAVFCSQKSSKFICFDVDVNDEGVVRKLIDVLVDLGFDRERIYISISGGKGYHVEIFFDKVVANESIAKLYNIVIERGGFNPEKVEFRPTPTQPIRLPLSKHYKTGVWSWYCSQETLKPIDSELYIFEIEQVPRERLDEILAAVPPPKAEHHVDYTVRQGEISVDENSLPVLVHRNTRHNTSVKIAVYLRNCGMGEAEIRAALTDWVARQDRDLIDSTDEEIAADNAEIAKWAGGIEAKAHAAKTIVINSADLNFILNGKTKNDRRLLFRMVMVFKVFGRDNTSQDLMARSLGMHKKTVGTRLKRLWTDRVVTMKYGRSQKLANGLWTSAPNTYLPGAIMRQVLDPDDFVANYEIGEKVDWQNILPYYAAGMAAMLGDKLAEYVGAREAAEIRALEGKYELVDACDGDD